MSPEALTIDNERTPFNYGPYIKEWIAFYQRGIATKRNYLFTKNTERLNIEEVILISETDDMFPLESWVKNEEYIPTENFTIVSTADIDYSNVVKWMNIGTQEADNLFEYKSSHIPKKEYTIQGNIIISHFKPKKYVK